MASGYVFPLNLFLFFFFWYAHARLPYWPSTKLIIVGCLIISHFDGSFYVYRHIVRPCLSLNPHNVINWFIKLKEFLNQDNILVEVKTEAKETRPDASDNLIALDSLPAFKVCFSYKQVQNRFLNQNIVKELSDMH